MPEVKRLLNSYSKTMSDLVCLPKPMSSSHCLQVSMGIPITAEDIQSVNIINQGTKIEEQQQQKHNSKRQNNRKYQGARKGDIDIPKGKTLWQPKSTC